MKNQIRQAFRLLFHYPAFGRLWVGRSIFLFGDTFTLIALPWFVLQMTGSGTAIASILLTLQLPAILPSMAIASLIASKRAPLSQLIMHFVPSSSVLFPPVLVRPAAALASFFPAKYESLIPSQREKAAELMNDLMTDE